MRWSKGDESQTQGECEIRLPALHGKDERARDQNSTSEQIITTLEGQTMKQEVWVVGVVYFDILRLNHRTFISSSLKTRKTLKIL